MLVSALPILSCIEIMHNNVITKFIKLCTNKNYVFG